jgi:uncharacterized membrane protein
MAEEKENNVESVNIDSTNIFDEFSGDEVLKEEIEKIKIIREKNSYYYLSIISKFLKFFNTIFILIFITFWVYMYIQNDSTITNADYLNPICNLFVESTWRQSSCASVSALLKINKDNYEKKEKFFYESNLSLVWKVYDISNFIFSKEVTFLLHRTENKLRSLEILEEFDKLKNEFEPINKSRLKCSNISINSSYILKMSCSAYSWNWDNKILWFSGKNTGQDNIWWTSISRASSFINFLEKKEKSKFILLNKQKVFDFVGVVGEGWYTRKTDFKLELKFKNNNIWL